MNPPPERTISVVVVEDDQRTRAHLCRAIRAETELRLAAVFEAHKLGLLQDGLLKR